MIESFSSSQIEAIQTVYELGYIDPADLASICQTSKKNYALVYRRRTFLSKLNRLEFLLRILFPTSREPLSRVAIGEKALRLVNARKPTNMLVNMASMLPQAQAIPLLRRAFEESGPSEQYKVITVFHTVHPPSARALVPRMEDSFFRTFAYIKFTKNHDAALASARQIKNSLRRDPAYRRIAEDFLDSAAIREIQDPEMRAYSYLKMAERKWPSEPDEAFTLVYTACQDMASLTDRINLKNRMLGEAVQLLAKLQPDAIEKIIPICKDAFTQAERLFNPCADVYRFRLVEVLKTVDIAKAEEVALSRLYGYPHEVFRQLISIENECYRSNPEKADQLLNRATQLLHHIHLLPSRVRGKISLAKAFLQRNNYKAAMPYIEDAVVEARYCHQNLENYRGLVEVASMLSQVDLQGAESIISEVVRLFTSLKREDIMNNSIHVNEFLQVVRRNFPSEVRVLFDHVKSFVTLLDWDIKSLYELGVSIDEKDATAKFLCDQVDEHCVRYADSRIAEFASSIQMINPKRAISLFKLAIRKAEKNAYLLESVARRIAIFDPRAAAGLYLQIYLLNKNPDMLLECAKLVPERALELLDLEITQLQRASIKSKDKLACDIVDQLTKLAIC